MYNQIFYLKKEKNIKLTLIKSHWEVKFPYGSKLVFLSAKFLMIGLKCRTSDQTEKSTVSNPYCQ